MNGDSTVKNTSNLTLKIELNFRRYSKKGPKHQVRHAQWYRYKL